MLSTIQSVPTSHTTDPSIGQSRKRRKRTAGGGAQDDCFACEKRGTACDRNRPYCTQCLDIGKECSGYKTTLTWGVGVASRGKLRGLSLPVASKHSVAEAAATSVAKRRKSSISKASKPVDVDKSKTSQHTIPKPINIPRSQFSPTSYPALEVEQASWQMPAPSSYASSYGQFGLSRSQALRQIETSNGHFDGMNFPSSASSTGSFADAEFHSPAEYAPSSYSFPALQHPYSSYLDPSTDPVSPSTMDINESTSSLDMLNSYEDVSFLDRDNTIYGQAYDQLPEIEEEVQSDTMIDTRWSNMLFHLPQRIQQLVHYYDTAICPFLVAFDSPQNPYRMHVIQLAAHNEGLQSALAALATNNMRMRRKENRQLGFIEDNSTADDQPSAEECRYKQFSIEQLNSQLVNTSAAQDDSVLATLLILCLFHVCDSGFSKFKTQLAGVQKLMSLRDPTTKSAFTGWVEMFFIWFDVMTAAVNDREPQIKGESLDMMDYSVNLGALEQFSGCDGRLFKLIARLGGLSLLAQGRQSSRSTQHAAAPPSPDSVVRSMRKRKPTIKAALDRSLDASDYEHLDGNGWGTPIFTCDDPNDRSDFWAEWHDIRSRLQSWNVDASTFSADLSGAGMAYDASSLTREQKDLVHISESFRHSALLYTERVAYPLLPSASPSFQHHVAQALYHITALPITSCVNKFLLWPLFITGTECVNETDRAVVRSRCIELQRESGFYNNISCLQVLEKVWSDVDMGLGVEEEIHARRRDSEVFGRGDSRQAFRWRRAMNRVDGEYLII